MTTAQIILNAGKIVLAVVWPGFVIALIIAFVFVVFGVIVTETKSKRPNK